MVGMLRVIVVLLLLLGVGILRVAVEGVDFEDVSALRALLLIVVGEGLRLSEHQHVRHCYNISVNNYNFYDNKSLILIKTG